MLMDMCMFDFLIYFRKIFCTYMAHEGCVHVSVLESGSEMNIFNSKLEELAPINDLSIKTGLVETAYGPSWLCWSKSSTIQYLIEIL